MLHHLLPQRAEARRILLATIFSAIGRGLTLPFMFIYLTKVRDISAFTAGLVIGWIAVCALVIGPIGGWAVDRFGARRIVVPMLLVEAAGVFGMGLVHNVTLAFAAATLIGLGGGIIWAGLNVILSSVTEEHERQKTFGLNFTLLNLGIGVGSVIAGAIVDIERPSTFQLIYSVDAIAYLIPFLNLLFMRGVGQRLAVPSTSDQPVARKAGYREVFSHPGFRRLLAFSVVMTISGYAQIEVGFTAFAIDVAHVKERVVALAFTANTLVIVLAQLIVVRLIQGRSRTRVLALVGLIMGASWLILGIAGVVDGRNAVISSIAVIACAAVFAFGETLISPVNPTLINALATDELRGRFNALGSMVWSISGIVGPVTAAPLIAGGHAGIWVALTVGGCLVASVLALSLRRLITPEQDGLEAPRTEVVNKAQPVAA
ncbi:MAG: MFS transporter [Hamadaea sp.]|uniref:MFS transporter n=1 Tax=Hamadaea sp. TaxID=2024425 RepID=UPI001815BA53|nr:MFS transporter [Hamadaea sp.]NUR72668.1 MFS transporter [Hamadaea sp.]NUT21133.1 MFS transporter [Hamadaea sp.]